jgi:hypothetical protein
VIATIEDGAIGRYWARMRTMALRLLALIAVLMLPFGMAAPAAVPAAHHSATAAMPLDHCPDQQSSVGHKGAVAECAMPCSSALPAADVSSVGAHPVGRTLVLPPLDQVLSQIELEIATPPPKPS